MENIDNRQSISLQTGQQTTKTIAHRAAIAFLIVLAAMAALAGTSSAQTFTVLHEFKGAPLDASGPRGSLIRDAAGNFYGSSFTGGGANEGTVFKMDSTGKVTLLLEFNNFNGSFPASSVVFDKSGNLFGSADEGPGGAGVLFKVAKDGSASIFHAFQGGTGSEAAVPVGGVITDAAGNVYGTTVLGGLGFGVIYRVDKAGNFKALYNFQGKADGESPQGPLVRDAAGNLYGATSQGGNRKQGTIFRLAPNGTFTILHAFGGRDGSGPQGGLLMDAAGTLYGAAVQGGDNNKGTLFQITKTGAFKRLYSFIGAPDGTNPNGQLVRDGQGTLYGTTQVGGDEGLGTVYKLTRTGELTVLHTFTGEEDGATPISGLIRDAAGTLYGTAEQNFLIDQRGGTIFKITF